VSEQVKPRPNIAQLEALLNEAADGEVEVQPNGDVLRLDATELLAKNYQLEKGRNELLLKEIKRLREFIATIHSMTEHV